MKHKNIFSANWSTRLHLSSRFIMSTMLLISILMPVKVWGKMIYLDVSQNNWEVSDAAFQILGDGNSANWIHLDKVADHIYGAECSYTTIKFERRSSGWVNYWNEGPQITVPADKNLYTMSDWAGNGSWSTYGDAGGDTPTDSECTFKNGTTIYLNLNGNDWPTDGGKPAAMFYYVDNANKNYGNNSTSWGGDMTGSNQIGNGNYVLATQVSGNYWKVTVPADNLAYVRFVRVQASNAEWTWNCQKNKLALADMGDNNCVKLGGWDANASWEKYGSGSAVEKACPESEPTITASSFRGDMWLDGSGWLRGSDALAPHFVDNGNGTATLKIVFPNAQCRLTLYHDGGDKSSDRCDGTTGITKSKFESSKYCFAATGSTKLYTFTLNTSTGRFTVNADAYPVQKTGWHVFVSAGDGDPTEVGTITEEDGLVIENLAAGNHNMFITDGSANPIWGVNKFGGLYIDKTNSDVSWATQRVYYDASKFSSTEFPIRENKDATGRFKLDAAGDVRIAFDGGKITINKVAAPEPAEELTGDWFIMGGHNGWSNNNPEHQMTISAGEATKTYYNVTSDFDFKVYGNSIEHGWSYYSQSKSDVTCTKVEAAIPNIKLPTITAPTDVTIHYDGRNVWVTTDQHKTFGTTYVLTGDFNGWNNTALSLTKIDDYTATITQRFEPKTYSGQKTCDEGKTQRLKIVKSGDWNTQIHRPHIHAESSDYMIGDDSCDPDNTYPRICVKVTQPTDVTFTIWKNSNDQMRVSIKAVPVQMQTVKFYDGDTEYTDKAQSVEAGGKPTAPTEPTKAGYKFIGWSETKDGAVVDITTITINTDKNFYAKWEVATLEEATLNKTSLTLFVGGESETLVGGALPVGVLLNETNWSVSPEGIVTVENGVVTPQSAGEAVITYTITDQSGNTKSATCNVKVQACAMTYGTRQNGEYNTTGMFNNASVKIKFQDNYYMHVVDGAPKMLQSEAETAEWREIPTGETFSPAWTSNTYPLFYLKHVETGKYLCRGNGRYGANGDWFYYVATVVDEPTGNDCLWFYDTTLGYHLVCREGATGSQLSKGAFMISICNINGAGDTFNQYGAKPQVVCHYAPDPANNVYTKLATVAWTRSTNPDDAGMTFAGDTERFLSEGSFTQAATSLSSAEIYYVSSDPAVATVNPTTGEVTPLTTGQTTITATLAADGCYNGDSKSYTLTISEKPASLQEIIDAAANGDRINVLTDYAEEDITIAKPIVLEGNNHKIGNLTITTGGNLTIESELTVNNFYLQANGASHTSGQVFGAEKMNVKADAFFDLTLANDHVQLGWYDFCVPFAVNVIGGITGIAPDGTEKTAFINEADYAVMEHLGEVRAQGQYGYKKFRGTLQPARLYTIALDDEQDYNTVRFRKVSGEELVWGNSVVLGTYSSGTATDANWNGLGNGALHHADMSISAEYVQVYNTGDQTFTTVKATDQSFVVGTAVMVQQAGGTMTLNNATKSTLLAPAREAEDRLVYDIQLQENANGKSDLAYFAAADDATAEYTIGHDLLKVGNIANVSVPQLWLNAYSSKLSVHEATMQNGQASSSLSLYAPRSGEFTIEPVSAPIEGYMLYLTEDGTPIWNLTMSPYTTHLEKGINSHYGLIIVRTQEIFTDIQGADAQSEQVIKFVKDGILYMQIGDRIIDANGQVIR